MLSQQEIVGASLYISTIDRWVQIIGACLLNEDKEFCLIWKSADNKIGTIPLKEVHELIENLNVVPF